MAALKLHLTLADVPEFAEPQLPHSIGKIISTVQDRPENSVRLYA